jgi:hypothetical protein
VTPTATSSTSSVTPTDQRGLGVRPEARLPDRSALRALPRPRGRAAATRWLAEVLGFREAIRFTVPNGGPVAHVELERDGAVIMPELAGSRFGQTSSITLVFVDDVNAACGRPSSPTRKISAGNSPNTYTTPIPLTGAPNRSGRFPVDRATAIFRTVVLPSLHSENGVEADWRANLVPDHSGPRRRQRRHAGAARLLKNSRTST